MHFQNLFFQALVAFGVGASPTPQFTETTATAVLGTDITSNASILGNYYN